MLACACRAPDCPCLVRATVPPGRVGFAQPCGSVPPVASVEDCRLALERLATRLASVDPRVRRRHSFSRSLSCLVSDLDVTFVGQLREGTLHDIALSPDPRALGKVRLTIASDDLVALTDGHLSFATAWARGRLKIDASMMDLLKLRAML